MKKITLIIIAILFFFWATTPIYAKLQVSKDLEENAMEEEYNDESDEYYEEQEEQEEVNEELENEDYEEETEQEEYYEEENYEDEPEIPAKPVKKIEVVAPDEDAGEGDEVRQIVIDSFINLNYLFDNSSDSFEIKYHVHLEGNVAAKIAVMKLDAEISTDVKGYLAKWPTGSCKLSVNIPKTPLGMTFRRSSEDKASIQIKFTRPLMETWESKCTFNDAPEAKFNTKGDPEKWLAKALQKARPSLSRLIVPLSQDEETTMKFEISKQTLKDPPIGTAEISGTGIVTIKPGRGE